MTKDNLKTIQDECQYTDFITVDQMAKRMQIARQTAYQVVKIEGFPCFYIGKRIMISEQLFSEWVKKQSDIQAVILEVE